MMTKKHFESIAEIIKRHVQSCREFPDREALPLVTSIAVSLAIYLKSQNLQFDVDRFYQSCGFEQGIKPY